MDTGKTKKGKRNRNRNLLCMASEVAYRSGPINGQHWTEEGKKYYLKHMTEMGSKIPIRGRFLVEHIHATYVEVTIELITDNEIVIQEIGPITLTVGSSLMVNELKGILDIEFGFS